MYHGNLVRRKSRHTTPASAGRANGAQKKRWPNLNDGICPIQACEAVLDYNEQDQVFTCTSCPFKIDHTRYQEITSKIAGFRKTGTSFGERTDEQRLSDWNNE